MSNIKKYKRIICPNSRTVFDKNEIRVFDNYCEIDTYDQFSRTLKTFKFSKEDLPIINKYNKWQSVTKGTHIKSYYLVTTENKTKRIYFHRLIMGDPKEEIDHINRDSTDNRRENLRLANRSDQVFNTRKRKSVSKIKGVYYNKKRSTTISPWHAELQVGSVRHYSNRYRTEEEAIYARYLMEQEYLSGVECYQDTKFMEESISKLTEAQKLDIKNKLINKWKH